LRGLKGKFGDRYRVSTVQEIRYLSANLPLPPGQMESTRLGSHYVVRAAYPHDYFHGKVRLSRLSSSDLQCLMMSMREKGRVPERDRIIFLDTETTGIQGGTGM